MQFSTVAVAAFLAVSASAYEVLTPTLNSTVAKGETVSIEWTSVDTDAEVFSVYLTNFQTAHWPPTVLSLAQNVPRDDKSIELRIPCDLSSDYGWQINFINGTNTYVIYAQSPVFSLDGDCVEPAPTSSYAAAPYPTATGYSNATTVHGTVTVTDHATATATLCKTVETVIYATPIVWFVEPSHEAVCDIPANPTATVTVTVTAGGNGGYPSGGNGGNGGVPTGYPSGGAGGNTDVPTGGAGGYPTGGNGEAPTGGAGGYPTGVPSGVAPPTGTGSYVMPTGQPEYTGAASTIKVNGAIALIVGAFAFLL